MAAGPQLEREHEFMLRAVEAAHAGVCFAPDAEIEHLEQRRLRGVKKLVHMRPVHAHKGEAAGMARSSHSLERCREERRVGLRRHREAAMTNSRWRTFPRPDTCPSIGTLYGGSVKTADPRSSPIKTACAASSRASPHRTL